ncbi:MAG: ArsR/SmtB family transcription factor [Arenicella sp.]
MVNNEHLNNTFHALADPTRRHIIGMLVEQQEHRIKELVEPFEMSFAAVSKHINVLERAGLVTRNRRGRETFIQLNPEPLQNAQEWIDFYQQFWTQRFSKLKKLIAEQEGSLDQ